MRYQVRYGSDFIAAKGRGYCLYDTHDKLVRFSSDSKSEVISAAQHFNKLEPVDGDENTYAKQIRQSELNAPHQEA